MIYATIWVGNVFSNTKNSNSTRWFVCLRLDSAVNWWTFVVVGVIWWFVDGYMNYNIVLVRLPTIVGISYANLYCKCTIMLES